MEDASINKQDTYCLVGVFFIPSAKEVILMAKPGPKKDGRKKGRSGPRKRKGK